MDLKRLFEEDDAVSPVIGVILMVAITVILAAVIAAVVLGIGGETQTTPQASFDFEYDSAGSKLTITQNSGEVIRGTELHLRGDCDGSCSPALGQTWSNVGGAMSTEIGGTSAVASGDRLTLNNVGSAYDIRVVWQPPDGETSATLSQDTGPDA